jgi:hypothetical protein
MQTMIPAQAGGMMGGAGINQMIELFKMQYLMKFMNGGTDGKSNGASLVSMAVLMGFDQLVKYIPFLITSIWLWLQGTAVGAWLVYQLGIRNPKKDEPLLAFSTQPPPPAQKSIRAFIQFERHPEKATDPRIDAVMYHVCTLPDVRSLRYNGVEMIPNFKDVLMIDSDVWFEIINPTGSQAPPLLGLGSSSSKEVRVEPILYRLSTYDHDITWLHKFVEASMERFEQEKKNKLGSETYYFDQITGGGQFSNPTPRGSILFTKSKFTSNRTLNNVYLKQIDELKQRVEFFMRRRDWYDSKGIPHTLGIVMYGVPGCGKTSTIKGIANETKRHIFNIALSEIKTKDALKDLFYNEQVRIMLGEGKMEVLNIPLKHRLYVIEDIDAMNSVVIKRSADQQRAEEERKLRVEAEMELLKRTQGEAMARTMMAGKQDAESDKLDLATLLNVLDGVRETPGRIIILSTNYPERLDEALLRPGRFDMMLEFEKHTPNVIKQHLEKHYDITLTSEQWKRMNVKELHHKWTPAEVSQILFRRVGDVDGAIEDLLNEDPKKLFKFSQMGQAGDECRESNQMGQSESGESVKTSQLGQSDSERSETSPLEQIDIDKQGENKAGEEESKGTSLIDLLESTESSESARDALSPAEPARDTTSLAEKKKITTEKNSDKGSVASADSFDDFFMSGGGVCLSLDPPTKEQKEAEERVRNILFNSQTSLVEISSQLHQKYNKEEMELRATLFPVRTHMQTGVFSFESFIEEDRHPKMKEFYQKRGQDIRRQMELAMLQSPLFVEKDEDGISCMDIGNGLCTSLYDENDAPSAYPLHENLPSWSAEVDEFFPEPLESFRF